MKKLLGILGTITIAGSGISGIVGNAPTPEKNEFSYWQTSNLENLKRSKRENKRILDINENLIINEDEKENYKSSMEKIISLLISKNIFISIFESNQNQQTTIYELNQNINYDYFTIPVSIIQRDGTRNIALVFRIRDLYLQGFINNINNTRHYYHFNREVQDDLISYPNINRENTHDLGYTGHYNNIMGERDQSIYWQNIASSFFEISNVGTIFQSQRPVVQAALGRIVLVTSELLRFGQINNLIINNIINNDGDGPIYWNPPPSSGQINIRDIVTNWQTISNNIIDVINNIQSRFRVVVNGNHIFDREFYNLLSELPTNMLWQLLRTSEIRVILGLIMQPTLNCDRRRARSINNYKKNEYCDAIKGQEQNYPLKNKKITAIKILDENKQDGNLKKGDIIIGTSNGVYILKNGNFKKVNYIGGEIININFLLSKVIVTNKNGTIYQMDYNIDHPKPSWVGGPYYS